MSAKLTWLLAFLGAYWAYCLYWGAAAGKLATSVGDFALADRRLPPWVFVIGATAMSFSGWAFFGTPGQIYANGLSFAETSLGAIAIPLTGVLFLKRQWLLGRRFGHVTPAEQYGEYFGGEGIRLLVLLIALVFAIPFVGMQLSIAGSLVSEMSEGTVDRFVAMWILTSVVFLYVCVGGLRAAAYIASLQGLLLALGIVGLGVFVLTDTTYTAYVSDKIGGLARAISDQRWPEGLTIPGVVQFTAGLGVESPIGGVWTSSMILTYCFALMGLQAAPAFAMWGFANRSSAGFAPQQVWASAAVIGVILVIFPVVQGMGALTWPEPMEFRDLYHFVEIALRGWTDNHWFAALLTLCGVAAVQATAAAYASTTAAMLARDIHRRYVNPAASDRTERLWARIAVLFIFLVALTLATYAPRAQAELGGLALSFGFQLFPALAAMCWFPWLTREGVVTGLVAGLVAVVLTEPLGASIVAFTGFHLPWGRWPWTIHSAGWGIVVNLTVCLIISWLSQARSDHARRARFHEFLRQHAGAVADIRRLKPVAWAITLAWLFFAIGPGALFGNTAFGDPAGGIAGWTLGVPSLWAWQILWWALGVLVLWFLAYKMELSTVIGRGVAFGPVARSPEPATPPDWRRWFWGAASVGAFIVGVHWMFG